MAAIECEKIQRQIYELRKLLETDLSPEERIGIEAKLKLLEEQLAKKMKNESTYNVSLIIQIIMRCVFAEVRALGTKIVHTDTQGKMFYLDVEGTKMYRLEPNESIEYILDVSVAILHFLKPKVEFFIYISHLLLVTYNDLLNIIFRFRKKCKP